MHTGVADAGCEIKMCLITSIKICLITSILHSISRLVQLMHKPSKILWGSNKFTCSRQQAFRKAILVSMYKARLSTLKMCLIVFVPPESKLTLSVTEASTADVKCGLKSKLMMFTPQAGS